MNYTKKEYDLLLYVRKNSRHVEWLRKRCKPKSDAQWNIWLSDLSKLYYVEPEGAKTFSDDPEISLNDIGETVAQAEFDRRFDMYFTRVISAVALITSIVSLILKQ